MYPTGELTRLGLRKALIRVRIAGHRWQCTETGSELARPVEVVDGLWAKWRHISPIAKAVGVPLAALLARRLYRRLRKIATIAHYVPMVLAVARMVAGRRSSADA
jgi:hypothetical protein